jgi:hypothetical protein
LRWMQSVMFGLTSLILPMGLRLPRIEATVSIPRFCDLLLLWPMSYFAEVLCVPEAAVDTRRLSSPSVSKTSESSLVWSIGLSEKRRNWSVAEASRDWNGKMAGKHLRSMNLNQGSPVRMWSNS